MENKKNNMKQAMYEMFGVGSMPAAEPAVSEKIPQKTAPVAPQAAAKPAADKTPVAAPAAPKSESAPHPIKLVTEEPFVAAVSRHVVSYLAPGTKVEGTLRSIGDVEIAGEFKGDIITEGVAKLRSDIQGNITAKSLSLTGCALTGDVVANGVVTVSENSKIIGNVSAEELQCAGQITGDLKITGNTVLEGTAQVNGSITTGTMSMVRGAVLKGAVEMKGVESKSGK